MSRFGSLKNLVLTLAVFGLVSIAAGTAKADIVVTTGVNNQGTDNVLLNPATNLLTVTGTVGANNLVVNFTSTSGSDARRGKLKRYRCAGESARLPI